MATQPEQIVLTYDDLLDLPEDRNRYEMYEGELEVTAAPTPRHQTVVGNLHLTLGPCVLASDLGRVLISPIDVKLSDITVVEPDLISVSKAREGIIGEKFVAGAPDLVIEVLSPSTVTRDRRTKRRLYAKHGVPHYWLFDPLERSAAALDLCGARYHLGDRASDDGTFSALPFPDLVIPLSKIWAS